MRLPRELDPWLRLLAAGCSAVHREASLVTKSLTVSAQLDAEDMYARTARLQGALRIAGAEKVMLHSPTASSWEKDRNQDIARVFPAEVVVVFGPALAGLLRLSADLGHSNPSGMPCVPPTVEAADAHQVLGGANDQHLPGELGAANEPALERSADALQRAEDLLDALTHADGNPIGSMTRGTPVDSRAALLRGHMRGDLVRTAGGEEFSGAVILVGPQALGAAGTALEHLGRGLPLGSTVGLGAENLNQRGPQQKRRRYRRPAPLVDRLSVRIRRRQRRVTADAHLAQQMIPKDSLLEAYVAEKRGLRVNCGSHQRDSINSDRLMAILSDPARDQRPS